MVVGNLSSELHGTFAKAMSLISDLLISLFGNMLDILVTL